MVAQRRYAVPRIPRGRTRIVAVAALLLGPAAPAVPLPPAPTLATAVSVTPSPSGDDGEWPAGGRFQDAGFADTGTVRNRIYGSHIPPELAPSVFEFQRVAAGGYQAELDFPAPVLQLHYYTASDSADDGDVDPSSALPVRYTVDLILQPPGGGPATVSLRADGTTVVTRSGAQVATSTTVFVGTRLIMAVPASVGVARDWTVQAVIQLAGDQPLNSAAGAQKLPATLFVSTEPAVVGVLSGDDGGAPEPFASRALLRSLQVGVQAPDTEPLPSGARPESMRIEQGAKGLVVVVTMDSPPKPATTVGGRPVNQQELHLSLAPGVQDGLGVGRVDVSYPFVLCATSPCASAKTASVVLDGDYLGSVPVTVSGREVRFDFGGFTVAPQPVPPQATPSPGEVLGTFTKTFDLAAQDLDMIPLAGAPRDPGEPVTVSVDGTSISIKRASESQAATGSINPFTAYFFASNAQEMWSGWLGTEGWYSKVVSQAAAPAAARLAPAQKADIGSPQFLDRLAHYVWVQKNLDAFGDETPGLIRWFAIAAGAPFNRVPDMPASYRHVVAQFLVNGGQFPKDVMDKAFPGGYDPIVVAPPPAPDFPLASTLPALSPKAAQWEIAAGMVILDRSGQGIRSLSPYVPASSLLSGATGATGGGPATASGTGAAAPSSSGGGAGVIVAVAIVVLVAAGGGALWLRRNRGGRTT